ncbi:unnamed protein product [Tuber aestivum]|uniref:Cytochrome c oxidase polypeptide V n=1 Tax=Tuber aestivum TaxID=59557 RepID=A0A292PVE6_9PEZI|nr:unnamed protein product [Tuber aestivum]
MLRNTALRAARLAVPASPSASVLARNIPAVAGFVQSRSASHAVSNVTLADIEKRWESMPPNEQADLWMSLRDRMKGSWGELTLQEKKASYWIAFGPHGPRAVPPADENRKVLYYTLVGLAASFALFYGTRLMARPTPKTMNREWQEQTDEYLKEQKVEPLTGYASPDYKGKGVVKN